VNTDIQADRKLTDDEKLLADVVRAGERIPIGFQIGMPIHLDRAIAVIGHLFTECHLPLRDELLSELRLWKEHAEAGLKFSRECDALMQEVIRSVGKAGKHR
jgi:hypothetical protein